MDSDILQIGRIFPEGYSGVLGWSSDDVSFGRVADGWSLESINRTIDGDNLDEVVVQDFSGRYHIIWSDELQFKDGWLKVGAGVAYNGVMGRVVSVDDEYNEERQCSVVGLGGAALGWGVAAYFTVSGLIGAGVGGSFGVGLNSIADICKENYSSVSSLVEN